MTQGYFAYTYLVANPTDETIHKVIVDAGNGQVLGKSEGVSLDRSVNQDMRGLDIGRDTTVFFGELFHNLPLGPASWTPFESNSNQVGNGSW